MRITRVLHVSVNVLDALSPTRTFYENLFQLDSIARPAIPGIDGHWFDLAGVELHLVDAPVPDEAIAPTAHHVCLGVPDLADAVAELERRGVPYVEGAQGPVRQIWIRDPAGNVVELQEDRSR